MIDASTGVNLSRPVTPTADSSRIAADGVASWASVLCTEEPKLLKSPPAPRAMATTKTVIQRIDKLLFPSSRHTPTALIPSSRRVDTLSSRASARNLVRRLYSYG